MAVKVHETKGTYDGAPSTRKNVVKLVVDNIGEEVTLNGKKLKNFSRVEDLMAAESGWVDDEVSKTIIAKSGTLSVSDAKEFVFTIGEPRPTPSPTPTPTPPPPEMYLRGTFNNWSLSDPMFKNPEGAWEITKNLSTGTIEYKFDSGDGCIYIQIQRSR